MFFKSYIFFWPIGWANKLSAELDNHLIKTTRLLLNMCNRYQKDLHAFPERWRKAQQKKTTRVVRKFMVQF